MSSNLVVPCIADDTFAGIKTLRSVPRTEAEIIAAHERNRGQSCEHLASGESLEMSSFIPELLGDRLSGGSEFPIPASRRATFSVGTDMADEDRSDLPTLTRGKILEYLGAHYVCVEVRVLRDLDSRECYLHHRPLAATAEFGGPRLTKEFTELVSDSVQNMRSLGLFVPTNAPQSPETYRTLVMIHKSLMMTVENGLYAKQAKPIYEFIFIRGRPAGDGLELHAFATSEGRRVLNYLRPFTFPKRPEECGIRGTIRFTEYRLANLLPAEGVTRRTTVRARARFPIEKLDSFALAQGWSGGFYDHLTEALDAIIDRKLLPATD